MRKDKDKVRDMFDSISARYDFLNHFLSLGIDNLWRQKVSNIIYDSGASKILDVATGTGDLAISMANKIGYADITAIDMSPKMLDIARDKVARLNLSDRISLSIEDALSMSFSDNSFDALTVSFGVRNFENLDKGLIELLRVVKPDGKLVILEVSVPEGILASPYRFYFEKVLPFIGRKISKNEYAYGYLQQTVVGFPSGESFVSILKSNGYRDIKSIKLMNSIAIIYIATK